MTDKYENSKPIGIDYRDLEVRAMALSQNSKNDFRSNISKIPRNPELYLRILSACGLQSEDIEILKSMMSESEKYPVDYTTGDAHILLTSHHLGIQIPIEKMRKEFRQVLKAANFNHFYSG